MVVLLGGVGLVFWPAAKGTVFLYGHSDVGVVKNGLQVDLEIDKSENPPHHVIATAVATIKNVTTGKIYLYSVNGHGFFHLGLVTFLGLRVFMPEMGEGAIGVSTTTLEPGGKMTWRERIPENLAAKIHGSRVVAVVWPSGAELPAISNPCLFEQEN